MFSEVVIFYRGYNFYGIEPSRPVPHLGLSRGIPKAVRENEDLWHYWLFGVFREMHKVRNFRLVLCVDVWYRAGMYPMGVLKHAVAVEGRGEGFDSSFPEPLVTYSQRRSPGSDNLGNTYYTFAPWNLL